MARRIQVNNQPQNVGDNETVNDVLNRTYGEGSKPKEAVVDGQIIPQNQYEDTKAFEGIDVDRSHVVKGDF